VPNTANMLCRMAEQRDDKELLSPPRTQERQPQPVSPPAPMQTTTIEEVTAQDMLATADLSAAQPDVEPHGSRRPRVTFADDVQGGSKEVSAE
jgi:hypothetical protein